MSVILLSIVPDRGKIIPVSRADIRAFPSLKDLVQKVVLVSVHGACAALECSSMNISWQKLINF